MFIIYTTTVRSTCYRRHYVVSVCWRVETKHRYFLIWVLDVQEYIPRLLNEFNSVRRLPVCSSEVKISVRIEKRISIP